MNRQDIWLERLRNDSGIPKCRAIDLYCGGGWPKLRETIKTWGLKKELRTWICSAGYGLLCGDEYINTYSATFLSGDRDSITPLKSTRENIVWWNRINKKLKKNCEYKTIAELAKKNPSDFYLVALPKTYLEVVQNDINHLEKYVVKGNLTIIEVGKKSKFINSDSVIEVDHRIAKLLGGVLSNIQNRLVSFLIDKLGEKKPSFNEIKKIILMYTKTIPEVKKRITKKMTDAEITNLICEIIDKKGNFSNTSALKLLRKSGYSCEQKRFNSIFSSLKGAKNEGS